MSIVLPDRPALKRRVWTPRLVATLALFVVSAAFFCAIVGNALVHQVDERQDLERRAALLGAIEDLRNSGADFARLEAGRVRAVERTAGLKDLRFETDPTEDDREVQSVLDAQGRIVGWFSWEPTNTMSDALGELRPLAAFTVIFLVGFTGLSFWQIRRTVRDLGGLPTVDGGATAFGRVARGPRRELLDARGWDAARAWGLRTVVDLRFDVDLTGG